MGAPPSYLGDAVAVTELAGYQEGPASVVVSRDGDDLVFWSSYDDCGRTIIEESRIAVADFVAKGEGPWPWYDLDDKRDGTLVVLDALGVDPPPWTTPLADNVLDLFDQARGGSSEVIELLAWGAEPDPVDPCGASPLWYAVRSLSAGIVVALIDAAMPSGAQPIDHAACRILPATAAAMVELGADPRRGLDALLSWWPTGAQFAGFRAGEVADVVDILRAGGAQVTDRHRELAVRAGASQVEAALRR